MNPELRKRFLREAQAAGQLDHPHLVPVHEVGEEGHLVYIASQYIEGPDLAQWLVDRNTPVPPRKAAELVADLADGVEHAHAHGILHRDIKPSNVLLAEDAGRLSPRLTDFGLAKLREVGSDETQTRTGVLLGTPTYMAPELAAGKLREVGPATDVYGLGAVLYESLTGRPPFRGEHDADTIYQVVHNEPLNPQRLRPGLSSEFAAICLKCLDKRAEKRYPSAASLAADLRRYLNGQPTLARPATPVDRAWKWARRRPAVAGLSLGLFATLAALTTVSVWYGYRLQLALANEQTLRREAEQRDMAIELSVIDQLLQEDRPADAAVRFGQMEGTSLDDGPREAAYLARLSRGETRRVFGREGGVLTLALAPSGRQFATGGADHAIRLWNVADGAAVAILSGHTAPVRSLSFRRDDGLLASGASDNKAAELLLWDPQRGQQAARLEFPGAKIRAVVFSSNGEWLAVAGSSVRDETTFGRVRVWRQRDQDGPAWALVRDWEFPSETVGVGFAADNRTLALGLATSDPHAVELWDVEMGQKQQALSLAGTNPLSALAVSADGLHLLASRDFDASVALWHFPSRQRLADSRAQYAPEVQGLSAIAFHPHGPFLATACRRFAAASNPASVMTWSTSPACRVTALLGTPRDDALALSYTADGRTLLVGGQDGSLRWWNVEEHTRADLLDAEGWGFVFSGDGRRLVGGGIDQAFILDLESGEKRVLRSPGSDRAHQGEFGQAAVSHDGTLILTGGSTDHRVVLWDARSGQHLAEWTAHEHVRCVIASPTAPLAATGGRLDRAICLWDLNSRKQIARFQAHSDRIRAMAPSPTGDFFASVSSNGETKLWRFADGQLLRSWTEPDGAGLWSVDIAPDGQTIAVGADDGTIRLRNVTTDEVLPITMRHTGKSPQPVWLDFSPDGRLLASGSEGREMMVWDYRSGTSTVHLDFMASSADWVGFTPDANSLYFAPRSGMIGRIALSAGLTSPAASTRGPAALFRVFQRCQTQEHSAALTLLNDLAASDASVRQSFAAKYLERLAKRELFYSRDQSAGLVCFDQSADGHWAVCGSGRGAKELQLYDLLHDKVADSLDGAHHPARAVRFLPGERWIVSGGGAGRDTELIFWDRSQAQELERIRGLEEGVRDLAVSRDGQWVAVLGDVAADGSQDVVLVDVAKRSVVFRWPVASQTSSPATEYSSLQVSPDGRDLLLVGKSDSEGSEMGALLRLNPTTGEQWPHSLPAPLESITSSRQGERVAIGGADGTIQLLHWPSLDVVARIPSVASSIPTLAFSSDGRWLASGYRLPAEVGYTSDVQLWDAASGAHVACLGRFVEGSLALGFSPDASLLVQACDHRSIRKLDLAASDYLVRSAHRGAVQDMAMTARDRLYTVGDDGCLRAWSTSSLKMLEEQSCRKEGSRIARIASTQPPRAVTVDERALIIDSLSREQQIEGRAAESAAVSALGVSPAGRMIVGDRTGRAELWDLEPARLRDSWQVGPAPVAAVALSGAKDEFPAAATGTRVTVWSCHFGLMHDSFETPDEVRALASYPPVLAIGLRNGQVLLWNVPQRRRLALIDAHFGPVNAIALSHDGSTLVSAGQGGDVRLWDARTGAELLTLNAPTVDVRCLRFGLKDQQLFAGLVDGTLVVWPTVETPLSPRD